MLKISVQICICGSWICNVFVYLWKDGNVMNITATANTILLNGQPYPKGSLRPHYAGNVISVIFPYFSNIPVDPVGSGLFSGNFSEYMLDGVVCASVEDFKAYEEANFYQ